MADTACFSCGLLVVKPRLGLAFNAFFSGLSMMVVGVSIFLFLRCMAEARVLRLSSIKVTSLVALFPRLGGGDIVGSVEPGNSSKLTPVVGFCGGDDAFPFLPYRCADLIDFLASAVFGCAIVSEEAGFGGSSAALAVR